MAALAAAEDSITAERRAEIGVDRNRWQSTRNKYKAWGPDLPAGGIDLDPETLRGTTWEELFTEPEHGPLIEMLTTLSPGGTDHRFPAKIQKVGIPIIFDAMQNGKQAVMFDAPTGFGKTGAFTLPVLASILSKKQKYASKAAHMANTKGPRALVLTLNRDLAFQHKKNIAREPRTAAASAAAGGGVKGKNGYMSGVLTDYVDGTEVDEDELLVSCLVKFDDNTRGKGGKGGGKGGSRNDVFLQDRSKAYVCTSSFDQAAVFLGLKDKPKSLPIDNLDFIIFDEADQITGSPGGVQSVKKMLAACPNAMPIFVSATIDEKASADIIDICSTAYGAGNGRAVQKAKVHQEQRSSFTADFMLHEKESKIEIMRGITAHAREAGKCIVFCESKKIAEALEGKFKKPREEGGMGEETVTMIHGTSHNKNVRLRDEALTAFMTQDTHNTLIATNVLSRGTDIKEIRTVINIELPVVGKAGTGADIPMYTHRMGRATRSETAGGKLVNVVGGTPWTVEGELAADGNTQKHDDAVRLLEVIKNEPTLKKHGAHYMVPREFSGNRLTKQTLEAPLEVEVRHEVSPGKFQWLKLKIVDHNYEGQTPEEKADVEEWLAEGETSPPDRGVRQNLGTQLAVSVGGGKTVAVDTTDHSTVHVAFDYAALNSEMRLYNKKTEAEQELIRCIEEDDFGDLPNHVQLANKVVADLKDEATMSANQGGEWRPPAWQFLERVRDEAILARDLKSELDACTTAFLAHLGKDKPKTPAMLLSAFEAFKKGGATIPPGYNFDRALRQRGCLAPTAGFNLVWRDDDAGGLDKALSKASI